MNEENYGIDIEFAHPRAVELIPEDFFWDCTDEFAPFGSDEGDMALSEYRDWRVLNPEQPTIECLKWVIESVGEMDFEAYTDQLADKNLVASQIKDEEFDDDQYIFILDVSVIATGFAQLVDEGLIEPRNKPVISTAIKRQRIWASHLNSIFHIHEYLDKLNVLERALMMA